MGFSVVGLPHYTIWHLYEPSVDDLRHMEELEEERKAIEDEEHAQAERAERTETYYKDPKVESEIDNAFVRDSVNEEQRANPKTTEDEKTKGSSIDYSGAAADSVSEKPKGQVKTTVDDDDVHDEKRTPPQPQPQAGSGQKQQVKARSTV
jgi:mannan polymerase II complex ANP1 subunit